MRPRLERIARDLGDADDDIATYAAMNVLRLKEMHKDEIEGLLPALRRATTNRSISVRFFARKALNEVRIAAAKFPEIHQGLEVLREQGRTLSWQDLLRTVVRCNVDEKLVILDLLKDIDDPQVVPALVAYLKIETDEFVLAEIVKTIGFLGKDTVIGILKEFLSHPDSRIRSNAAEALDEIGGKAVVEALVPLLQDDDNRVKATVAKIIARHGETNVLSTLATMLRSVEIWMRMSACYALGFIEYGEAVDLLIEALMDVNPDVRRRSMEGLGQLRAQKAADFIGRFGSGSELEIQQAVDRSLQRIRQDPREYPYFDPASDLARHPGYLKLRNPSTRETPVEPVPSAAPAAVPRRRFNPFGIFDGHDLRRDESELTELLASREALHAEIGRKALKLHADGQVDRPYLSSFDHEIKKLQYLIKQKESHRKEIKKESLHATFVNFLRESASRFSMEKRVEKRLSSLQDRLDETFVSLGKKVMEEYQENQMDWIQLDTLPNRVRKLDRDIDQLESRMEHQFGPRARSRRGSVRRGEATAPSPGPGAPGETRAGAGEATEPVTGSTGTEPPEGQGSS